MSGVAGADVTSGAEATTGAIRPEVSSKEYVTYGIS
ncbi:hypothetical protein SAMN05428945_1623 [Streptomyces sp. 2224.1]|nr:hypothetical protein SAMN05428945_1623 [Streptomyces sp. 2224.1]